MSKTLRRATLAVTIVLAFAVALTAPAVALATPTPTYVSTVAAIGHGLAQLWGPTMVATDRLGNVFVVDMGNNRIQKFTSAGVYADQWTSNGTSPMNSPRGVATDLWSGVYVTEGLGGRVDKYDSSGTHRLDIGGTGAGAFGTPSGIAVDPLGFIYVADSGLNCIKKFDQNGAYLLTIGATVPGGLSNPTDLAIDPFDNVYVSDTANHRIVEFSPTGAFIRAFGSLGAGDANLNGPGGLEFGPDGNLLVADRGNKLVKAFSPTGTFLYSFGQAGLSSERTEGPDGVAVDGTGIFVADNSNFSLLKFTYGAPKSVTRIGGRNRYALAANVAAARWPRFRGMRHVIVVNGEDSAAANALAVSPLAGVYNAPILLTAKTKLSAETHTALKQMRSASGPLSVHVIGDTRLISKATYKRVRADNHGGSNERINGHDPYTISIRIARRVKAVNTSRGLITRAVLIFNAQKPGAFMDALIAGAGAARAGAPMLAVKNASVPTAVKRELATTFAGTPRFGVSSSTYISGYVLSQAGASGRLSNHGDHALSAADISFLCRDGFVGWDSVGAVNTLPAALVAGPYEGLQNGFLLYTRKTVWPTANTTFLGAPFFTYGPPKGALLHGHVIGSAGEITNTTKWHVWNDLNTP